jgi:riboflavin kinase/FMN adenylyltransferase
MTDEASIPRAPSVVVVGNFDGVHRGHQAVLAQARAAADALRVRCVVLTFDPHPAEVLGRGAPPRLTTMSRRRELLLEHGADEVVVEPFSLELAAWSPERFARELLSERLGAQSVVVGDNFRFGQKRAGDFAALRALGGALGFQAVAADRAGDARGAFSSTRVRDAIRAGDMEEAATVLGRAHELSGQVEHGDHLGRTLGFPTANLGGGPEMLPPFGVYAVRVGGDGAGAPARWGGVMNLGVRPTVDGTKLRVEVHLFDADLDLYGRELRVAVAHHLRGERKFAGLPALKAQIAADAAAARTWLAEGS